MIEQPKEALWLIILYALTAISGGLGGCASWAWTSHKFDKRRRYAFIVAYIIIGTVFGVIAMGTSVAFFSTWITDLHELILFSLLSGGAGSLLVFAINWGAGLVLRWKGIELRLTFRDHKQERRCADEDN